jgi:hypothetical protein
MKSILFNTFKYPGVLLFLGILLCSQPALAERCEPQENNEYEKIFCQLKRSGRGATLPNIYQFRENPPLTQALLLKKPAERAGIVVEIPERDNQETLRRQEDLLIAETAAQGEEGPRPLDRSVRTVAVVQQAPVVAAPAEPPAPVATTSATEIAVEKNMDSEPETVAPPVAAVTNPLEGCSLQQWTVECAHGRYQLVGNKTNQQLPADALSADHKLGLPVYSGAVDDNAALEEYLTRAYSRYLAGMLEIGLGGSTMSYGKFVNLHKYITDQRLDFAGRFETMYQFLKKDKQSIGVSTKLTVAEGLVVQDCSSLDDLIVCDYQKANYIFAKAD